MLSTDLSTEYPAKPLIFIILVHFGDPRATTHALTSLLAGSALPQKIIVIDHASEPYTVSASHAQRVQLIRPSENNGYGGGADIGLGSLLSGSTTAKDIVVIMNNDCVVGVNTLAVIQEKWSGVHQGVLVGSTLGLVQMFTGRARVDDTQKTTSWTNQLYVDGSFLVASYDTWLLLKGIPDIYFLYWEDVALSWLARKRGVTLVAWPDMQVYHHMHTAATGDDKLYYLVRNGAVVLETLSPWGWRLYWWLFNRLRYAYHRDPLLKSALADAVHRRLGRKPL